MSQDSFDKWSDGKKPVGRPKQKFDQYEKESLKKIKDWKAILEKEKKTMTSKDKQKLRN